MSADEDPSPTVDTLDPQIRALVDERWPWDLIKRERWVKS